LNVFLFPEKKSYYFFAWKNICVNRKSFIYKVANFVLFFYCLAVRRSANLSFLTFKSLVFSILSQCTVLILSNLKYMLFNQNCFYYFLFEVSVELLMMDKNCSRSANSSCISPLAQVIFLRTKVWEFLVLGWEYLTDRCW
jgi:hypothetical protein